MSRGAALGSLPATLPHSPCCPGPVLKGELREFSEEIDAKTGKTLTAEQEAYVNKRYIGTVSRVHQTEVMT
jgi:hypothetical protein